MNRRSVDGDGRDHDSMPRGNGASGASERMLRAVNAATSGADLNGELDAAAKALVLELRRDKEPPEQVLLHIKEILAEAGLRPSHGPADPALILDRDVCLYRNVIESTIRHYFDGGGGDGQGTA